MGRASISIAITSNFNSHGVDACIRKMEQLAVQAVHMNGTAGKALVDSGAAMGIMGARMEEFGKRIASIGDSLMAHVTVPLGIATAASITAAAKIDSAWYDVRKTVDMTEQGYEELRKSAIELSNIQPVSADKLLGIEAMGGQLGIANENLKEFARVVSGLEIATNLTWEDAASNLAKYSNITQMAQGDIERLSSVIVDLGNHMATTESDTLNLALRFASAGHVAGMTDQEIVAISASLSALGMKAEAGGSALSQVINKIALEVDTKGENLRTWAELAGQSVEEFCNAWKSKPAETFMQVLSGIAQEGDRMNAVLDDADVKQIRTSDAMRRLASSGSLVRDAIDRANKAWSDNTALTTEVERRNESVAAKFETIWNRLTNTAAEFGRPLADITLKALDFVGPLTDHLQAMADAFSRANPLTQTYALNLALVVAAAGPLLSVTGRVIQALGNVGKHVGRAAQQLGVYRDAMHTVDVSQLTTLSNNHSFAATIGASNNAIVRACGGLDRFNIAYRKTADETRKAARATEQNRIYQEAYTKAIAEGAATEEVAQAAGEKALKTREAKKRVTAAERAAIEALNDSIDKNTAATVLNAEAVSDAEVKAAKAERSYRNLGAGLKGIVIGSAVTAGLAALGALATYVATRIQVASERAENLRKATDGMRKALRGGADAALEAARGTSEANRVWGESVGAVDAVIEKQAALAEQFASSKVEVESQTMMLDRALAIVSAYMNQTGLTAAEQFEFKEAVSSLNSELGTQYEVVDAANGKIADQNGVIQENTDAINENVEARKRQIRYQAAEQGYADAWQQEVEAKRSLKAAQDELNDAMERYRSLIDPTTGRMREGLSFAEKQEFAELATQIGELEDAVRRGGEAVESAEEATRNWEWEMGRAAERANELGDSLEGMLSGSTTYTSAFGESLGRFAAACETLGINFASLNVMGVEAANGIASSFDGSALSVVRALESAGEQGETILKNIGNNWVATLDPAVQTLVFSVTSMKDKTAAELEAMVADYGLKGAAAISTFLAGLEQGWDETRAAQVAKRLSSLVDEGLDPERAAIIARTYTDALVSGLDFEVVDQIITGFSERIEDVLDPATIQALADAYDGSVSSILDKLAKLGKNDVLDHLASNWRSSMSEATRAVIDSVTAMGDLSLTELHAMAEQWGIEGDAAVAALCEALMSDETVETAITVARLVAEGMELEEAFKKAATLDVEAYVKGIKAGSPKSKEASGKVARDGADEAISMSDYFDSAGRIDIGAYAAGLAAGGDKAVGEASAVANRVAAVLSRLGDSAYSWGLSVVTNFAAGVRYGNGFISSAADSVAWEAAHLLRHSTPKAGPLKHDDVWGLHMAQNLASGMQRGIPAVRMQAQALAQAASAARDGMSAVWSSPAASRARAAASTATRRTGVGTASASPVAASPMAAPASGIDYDRLAAVVAAAAERGCSQAVPQVYLDGREVTDYVDRSLGRRGRGNG